MDAPSQQPTQPTDQAQPKQSKSNQSDQLKTYDPDTLKNAAFLAFFPLTGIFGLHEAVLRQYKFCAARMMIILLTIMSIIITAFSLIDIPPGFPQVFFIITSASSLIVVALYAWAIAEGVQYLQESKEQKDNIEQVQEQNPQKEEGKSTIVAFVIAVILICWWGGVFLSNSTRNAGCSGDYTGVFFLLLLSIPIDAILSTLLMNFGIKGLKTKSRGLAIASVVMKGIAFILMIGAFIYIVNLGKACPR